MKTITATELAELHRRNPHLELLDVRTPAEFAEVHVSFARNLPLDQLNPREYLAGRNGSSGQPLYFICRSGKRSEMAAERFVAAGFHDVINVQGGTTAAVNQGLPVEKSGKKAISVERQVQMTAGAIILTGVALSFFHWSGILVAGMIGGGLMFAGLTDSCPMGQLLLQMPWNRSKPNQSACCSN